jgi:hypothetical protein
VAVVELSGLVVVESFLGALSVVGASLQAAMDSASVEQKMTVNRFIIKYVLRKVKQFACLFDIL